MLVVVVALLLFQPLGVVALEVVVLAQKEVRR
jgi:hypothetical protein